MGGAELIDMAVEGMGDAAGVSSNAKGSCVEIDGQRIAHLRYTGTANAFNCHVRPHGALPAVATPAAQAGVADENADHGALAAQSKLRQSDSAWQFAVMTRGGSRVR